MCPKRLCLLAFVWLTLLVTLGCEHSLPMPAEPTAVPPLVSSPDAPQTASPTPTGQSLTLWFLLTPKPEAAVREITTTFNEKNEWGIRVRAETAGPASDVPARLTAAIQAGELPDLIVVPADMFPDLVEMDVVSDDVGRLARDEKWRLSPSAETDLYLNAFPRSTPTAEVGHVAVPLGFHVLALVYNPAVLQRAGVTEPPDTWEEFEKVCRSFLEATGQPCLSFSPEAHVILNLAWTLESTFMQTPTATAPDEGVRLTAILLRALADNGAALPQNTHAEAVQAALEGRVAFAIAPTSALPLDESDTWAIAPPPRLGERPALLASGPLLVLLNTGDPSRELAAWLFARTYLSSPAYQATFAQTGFLPVGRQAARRLAPQSPLAPAFEWLPFARPRPLSPAWTALAPRVEQVALQLLNRELTPDEALTILAKTEEQTP